MKNNQFCRSMIEMLGVLAIIGVLSVGGIVGRYNNNDILPMSPDLAAKGCSCSGNTCQFSVMFP